jgi:hypothetical protein
MRWFWIGILAWGCGASNSAEERPIDATAVEADAARGIADAASMLDEGVSDARSPLDDGPGDARPVVPVDGGPGDATVPDAEPDAAPVVASISLPQALGGALRVNPAAQPSVNLRIRVEGAPREVTLRIAGSESIRAEQVGNEWLALLGVEALPEGAHRLEVTATGFGPDVSVAAELVVSREGLQLTDFFTVGRAGTPRLHRREEQLFLTWTDRRDGPARLFVMELDGAGRPITDPAVLVEPEAEVDEVLNARVVYGRKHTVVLYQTPGQPFRNFLAVLDADGLPVAPPEPLDPRGDGHAGGEVTFDGTHFDLVWRSWGAEDPDVRWMRLEDETLARIGPLDVAVAGDGMPDGGFLPFTPVGVAPGLGRSFVTFTRDVYDARLELFTQRAQWVEVSHAGEVGPTSRLARRGGFFADADARVFRNGFDLLRVWSTQDLTAEPQGGQQLLVSFAGLDGVPEANRETVLVENVQERNEPLLLNHPTSRGVLAWSDFRQVALEPFESIHVRAGRLVDGPALADETVLSHSVLYASQAHLHGVSRGGNVSLVWIDERHAQGLEPAPEVYLDTLWFAESP